MSSSQRKERGHSLGIENLEARTKESSRWLRLLGLFIIWLFSFVLVCSVIDKNFFQMGLCLLILLGFSAWGHVIVYPLYYQKGRLLEGFIWGCTSGIAIGALITASVVYLIGWNLMVILGSIVVLPALVFLFLFKRKKLDIGLSPSRKPDLDILFMAMLVVTLFFYFPFKNLGALVGDKYVYAWLFGHDFINRTVLVVSMSQGLPPDYFNFSGEILNYYWLAYVYPALLYNINWIKLDPYKILKFTSLFYSLLTVGALFIFLRQIVHKRKHLLLLMCLAIFCYSYNDIYIIALKLWRVVTGETYLSILGYNVSKFSGFSHTFYRFFLVQFQSTFGIAVMLMIFSMYRIKQTLFGFFIMGILLGLLFGVEATNGIMLVLWFVCMTVYNFLINHQDRVTIFKRHLLSIACAALVYSILFVIEMYSFQTGKGVLQVAPNWFSILFSPFYFPLEYGPMFLFAIMGLIKVLKHRETINHWVYPYIILLAIGFFFTCFIINPAETQFGLLKATRIIPIGLLVLTAYFFQNIFHTRKIRLISMVLLLLALPTFFTDNFLASDISNPSSTYVRHSDMEAAKWIRSNLPTRAIIQAEPNYPGIENKYKPKYYYSFIPAFAERRTAIGELKASSVAHSNTDKVGERFHSIKRMFSTINIKECIRIIKKYNIEYIYVGKLEKKLYSKGVTKFYNYNKYFEKIYSSDEVDIFQFKLNNNSAQ